MPPCGDKRGGTGGGRGEVGWVGERGWERVGIGGGWVEGREDRIMGGIYERLVGGTPCGKVKECSRGS